jgi:hypothetical protein
VHPEDILPSLAVEQGAVPEVLREEFVRACSIPERETTGPTTYSRRRYWRPKKTDVGHCPPRDSMYE